MANKLPRLRVDLDFMPSPVEDRPGLLIRDSLGYSDVNIIVPPPLVNCLQLFDGEGTDLDLRQMLVQMTGDLRVGELEENLLQSLSQAGFLEDQVYAGMRDAKHREFAGSPVRNPSHAGAAYPADPDLLQAGLRGILDHSEGPAAVIAPVGIAAPHVSFDGGHGCYHAAYRRLPSDYDNRTFVILGTSHHGAPDKFGLTRKPFVTPLGKAVTAADLAAELAAKAPDACVVEDYCHSVEHSIEFQVLFLQHLFGPAVRILPILCGAFGQSLYEGGMPEDNPGVRDFLSALREMITREGSRLCWILGIDLAHVGPRYGDGFAAVADRGEMTEVAERDRERLERVAAGDADGFWKLVQRDHDDLRWCGASPLYTYLRARPETTGEVLRYEQWNIDERSVVTFAALSFQ